MRDEYLSSLRGRLKRRYETLVKKAGGFFHFGLKGFWCFLHTEMTLAGLLQELEVRNREAHARNTRVVDSTAIAVPAAPAELKTESGTGTSGSGSSFTDPIDIAEKIVQGREAYYIVDESMNLQVAYEVLGRCVASDDRHLEEALSYRLSLCGSQAAPDAPYQDFLLQNGVGDLIQHYLDPVYAYLMEGIDEQQFVMAYLSRYRQKVEFFPQNCQAMLKRSRDTKRAEEHLKLHTFEYLHDQGLNVDRETASPRGRVDFLIQRGSERHRLVVEAKVFDPDRKCGKAYILSGFNQTYEYVHKHNQPYGCLLVYCTSARVGIDFQAAKSSLLPYVVCNGKSIYLLVVDVAANATPVSRRGQRRVVSITQSELAECVERTMRDTSRG